VTHTECVFYDIMLASIARLFHGLMGTVIGKLSCSGPQAQHMPRCRTGSIAPCSTCAAHLAIAGVGFATSKAQHQ